MYELSSLGSSRRAFSPEDVSPCHEQRVVMSGEVSALWFTHAMVLRKGDLSSTPFLHRAKAATLPILPTSDPSDAPHHCVHLQVAGLPHNPGPVHQSASPAVQGAVHVHAVHGAGVRDALGGVPHGPGAARCSRGGHSHAHGGRERREPHPVLGVGIVIHRGLAGLAGSAGAKSLSRAAKPAEDEEFSWILWPSAKGDEKLGELCWNRALVDCYIVGFDKNCSYIPYIQYIHIYCMMLRCIFESCRWNFQHTPPRRCHQLGRCHPWGHFRLPLDRSNSRRTGTGQNSTPNREFLWGMVSTLW